VIYMYDMFTMYCIRAYEKLQRKIREVVCMVWVQDMGFLRTGRRTLACCIFVAGFILFSVRIKLLYVK
jgi:hypothetical protein